MLASGQVAGQDSCAVNPVSMRPVTVADTICMTKFGDHDYSVWGASSEGHVAQFSPDETKFVVVLRKGNIKNNTNDYSILLWRTEDVFNSSVPELLLTMSSSSNRAAIEKVKWLPDNETLVFLGEHPGEQTRLYTFNVRTRALTKYSGGSENLLAYDLSPDASHTAYVAEGPVESLWDTNTDRMGSSYFHTKYHEPRHGQARTKCPVVFSEEKRSCSSHNYG